MDDFIKPISEDFKELFFLEGDRNGRYPYSHSLLIKDYLIDTGISGKRLRKLKKAQFPIRNVLFTHWHEDHISGNRLLKESRFHSHINDKMVIEDIINLFKKYYCIVGTPAENLFDSLIDILRIEDTRIDQVIKDNEIIKISEDYQLEVIHTPGHSAGHCCFLELNSKIVFLGDIDLSSFGPWYAGLDSNLIEFEDSIAKMNNFDIDIAISSHKGLLKGRKFIKDKLKDYQSIIDRRDEDILEHFTEKKSVNADDLSKKNIIYKRYSEYEAYDIQAEKIMFEKHFEKFLKNNIITPKDNGYTLN